MKKMSIIILTATFILTSCINKREITESDFKVTDLNRPSITEHTPFSDAVDVSIETDITIYFSKLMNTTSIEDNFILYRVVDADSILTVAIDNDNGTIFSGKKNQGMFRMRDGDDDWYWISETHPNVTVNKLAIAASNTQIIFGLTNIGVIKSSDGGDAWNVIDDRIFTAIAIDRFDENSIYLASSTEGVLFSNDGGTSWLAKNTGLRVGRPLSEIVIEYSGNQILFLSSIGDYIYRSVNGAESWERVRAGLGSRDFNDVSIAPSNSSVLYSAAVNGSLYKSTDLGDNWSNITSNLPSPIIVNDIEVSFVSDSTIYIATSDGLFSSKYGGTNWSEAAIFTEGGSITEPGVVFDIAIKESDTNYIICGASNGIFISTDGGEIFEKKSAVSKENLYVSGEFQYETWQGETIIISNVDSTTLDTSIIAPYVIKRGLTLWEANGRVGDPPIEANPKATKMIFTPSKLLAPNWLFKIKVYGTFESDDITPLESRGAEDIFGNSIETSKSYKFTTGRK